MVIRCLRGLTGSTILHRSVTPGFKSGLSYIRTVFHFSTLVLLPLQIACVYKCSLEAAPFDNSPFQTCLSFLRFLSVWSLLMNFASYSDYEFAQPLGILGLPLSSILFEDIGAMEVLFLLFKICVIINIILSSL